MLVAFSLVLLVLGRIGVFARRPIKTQEQIDAELKDNAPYIDVGGVLCRLMAPKLPCPPQLCNRHLSFSNDEAESNKVVISYAHNGFGNQLWEHSFAWQVDCAG